MALSPHFLRKFVSSPREAMRIKRAADEVRSYTVWRMFTQLESEGLLQNLREQAWWSFKDQALAKLIGDILVEEGLAEWKGDRLEIKRPPEKPTITTNEAADMVPAIDRAMEALPRALMFGEKPSRGEAQAALAKFLDNFAIRLEYEVAIEETGLDKLDAGSTVADIHPRVGASTLTLLERTKARIIVIEPYPENVEVVRRLVRLHGQEDRVSFISATPEEAQISEKVDAVFMGQVIHWVPSPRLVLASARRMLKEGGMLAMAQTVYSSVGMVTGLPGYLLGAVQPPPQSSELKRMITGAGFEIDKWVESFGIVLVKASPT